jgi:hypothetical protein
MQIFIKSENHACMNEQIFENLYGEKQHEQAAKQIANGALNSYSKIITVS